MTTTLNSSIESSLDSALRPIQKSMTPEVARALSKMRIDRQFQLRLDQLAEKNTEGELSPAERNEYDHHLIALSFITMMKSKARQKLRQIKSAK